MEPPSQEIESFIEENKQDILQKTQASGVKELQEDYGCYVAEDAMIDAPSINTKSITSERFHSSKSSSKSQNTGGSAENKGICKSGIRNPFSSVEFEKYNSKTVKKSDLQENLDEEEKGSQHLRRSERIQKLKEKNLNNAKKDKEEKKEKKDESEEVDGQISSAVIKQMESFVIERENNKVSMESIWGYQDVKRELKVNFIFRQLNPELYEGNDPVRSLLLYGPPGNGKTLFAQVLAAEMKRDFINVKTANLLSKWHGGSENILEYLFRFVEKREPCVVFFDEIDSLFKSREQSSDDSISRLVNIFNMNVGGVRDILKKDIILVGATNLYKELDISIKRRFLLHIKIVPPPRETVSEIIAKEMSGVRGEIVNKDYEKIVDMLTGYCISDIITICNIVANQPFAELTTQEVISFTKEDIRAITYEDFKRAIKQRGPSYIYDNN